MRLFRLLPLICLLAVTAVTSCDSTEEKEHPDFKGTDPRAQPYVTEFLELAQKRGIVFNKNVTLGFKNLNSGNTIGVCWMAERWREIEIDTAYWDKHPGEERKFLLFHELTHCFCSRDHDHDSGQLYPTLFLGLFKSPFKSDGYFPDGCPKSIMAPVIAKPYCLAAYADYYIDEMFNRCQPW